MKTMLRRTLRLVPATVLTVVTLAGLLVAGAVTTSRDAHRPAPASSTPPAPGTSASTVGSPRSAPVPEERVVVAFVVGAGGTIASDLLAPYDLFASSPAFSVYTVATTRSPAMLVGGPALVPAYAFADVDADPGLRPDLVVVPGLTDPTGAAEADLRAWVARQHDRGSRVLGVCTGARVLASAGVLDGRVATSHWSRIAALQESDPDVRWVRGRAYVDDGDVTTTGAITSGIPASLHLIAEIAGDRESRRVAALHPELGWTPSTSTAVLDARFSGSDVPVAMHHFLPWLRPTLGIVLSDGVSELDATAVFEVYSQSAVARTVAVADGSRITTRHGLVLLTTPARDAPRLDRQIAPVRGFSGALDDLAAHADAATSASTAKMLGYPAPHGGASARVPLRPLMLAALALAGAVLVGAGAVRLPRLVHTAHRRARTRPSDRGDHTS